MLAFLQTERVGAQRKSRLWGEGRGEMNGARFRISSFSHSNTVNLKRREGKK